MFGPNHKHITRDALNNVAEKPSKSVKDVIARANNDSDKHMPSYAPQHFQEKWRPSMNFYQNSLKYAATVLANYIGKKKKGVKIDDFEITKAFYILGRSFHCLQDFYAHSNWVALGKVSLWDEGIKPKVFLSKMTPKDRTMANVFYYSPLGKWNTKKNRQKHFDTIKNQSLEHPDMQLDIKHSFPSELCKEFLSSKKYGYDIARNLAKDHTEQAWNKFINKVKLGSPAGSTKVIKEIMKKDKLKERKNWTKLRTECWSGILRGAK